MCKRTYKFREYIVKPASHLDAVTLEKYQISGDTTYSVLSSYPTNVKGKRIEMLHIECDDGEIRSISHEKFEKVNAESDS